MIVETGYYNNWYPQNATYNFTSTWPASAAGQKKFLDDLVAATKDLDYVTGLLYWFPEENPYNNRVYEPWYNHGLFDPSTGRATDALFSLKAFLPSQPSSLTSHLSPLTPHPSPTYDLQGRRVANSHQRHGVYITDSRKTAVR